MYASWQSTDIRSAVRSAARSMAEALREEGVYRILTPDECARGSPGTRATPGTLSCTRCAAGCPSTRAGASCTSCANRYCPASRTERRAAWRNERGPGRADLDRKLLPRLPYEPGQSQTEEKDWRGG